jgi:hypothetical protein
MASTKLPFTNFMFCQKCNREQIVNYPQDALCRGCGEKGNWSEEEMQSSAGEGTLNE